jgi:hypothetical protein
MCQCSPDTPGKVLAAAGGGGELCAPAGFEGAEKRLELDFVCASAAGAHARAFGTVSCAALLRGLPRKTRRAPPHAPPCDARAPVAPHPPDAGLRALSRPQLDSFLSVAECCVVSETHTPAFDAYVLSESSLFVYPTKLMIKTCGTTALLAALPRMLALAREVGALPRRVRYSRACFKYPKLQPAPHRSWEEECAYLDAHYAAPERGTARVLGARGKGLLWHVYVADASPPPPPPPPATAARAVLSVREPNRDDARAGGDGAAVDGVSGATTLTLEICMTQLHPDAASAFIFGDDAPPPSAASVSASSGIRAMFADAILDDFVFAPCGYSMNALQGPGLATIHVTPEARCSYASVEISGHAHATYTPAELLRKALRVFQPAQVSVAITCDVRAEQHAAPVPLPWAKLPLPEGYARMAHTRAELPGGGWVMHATMARETGL